MKNYVIASFYKFVTLADYHDMREPLLGVMRAHSIFGTIILAHEGINGSFAGTRETVNLVYDYLRQDPRFEDLYFKETHDDTMPFEKAKVKFRKEIVTLGVGELDVNLQGGERVCPEEWNELIRDPNVVVVDTRNSYEVELGTFQNALSPNTENFRDFPAYVQQALLDKKDQKIAMFCTGGIRCEKSTAYLKQLGFNNVYQLDGGILNYLDSIPEQDSLWQGSCFVFDERIAIK